MSSAHKATPGPRAGGRGALALLLLVLLAGLSAGLMGASAACLPDLAPISTQPTSGEGSTPFVGCGDGVIATLDDGGDAGESCDPGKPNDPDAQALGCKSCQIVCENGGVIDPSTGHCYFAAGASDNYQAAITSCKARGAHVVTFASKGEVALVQGRVVGAAGAGGFWIGLSRSSALGEAYGPDRGEEPGFPSPTQDSCAGCFGVGVDADGGTFAKENPAETLETRCVAARSSAWFQVPCKGTSRTTICEREPVGTRATTCIGGYCFTLPTTAGRKSYLVSFGGAEPTTAMQSCAQLPGGSLVVLDTAEEREQLAHEILLHDDAVVDQELWIGVAQDAGTWSWEDGVSLSSSPRPLPWGNAQPDDASGERAFMRLAATAYDTQLAYADRGAGAAKRLFICQRSPQ